MQAEPSCTTPTHMAVRFQSKTKSPAYGATAEALGMKDDRRLKYPLPATFPVLPLGYLTFQSADKMALCTMAMLIPLTIGWLRARWNGTTIAYTVLAFASYQ